MSAFGDSLGRGSSDGARRRAEPGEIAAEPQGLLGVQRSRQRFQLIRLLTRQREFRKIQRTHLDGDLGLQTAHALSVRGGRGECTNMRSCDERTKPHEHMRKTDMQVAT